MRPNPVSPTVIAAAVSACAFEPEALNSERIEDRFGSYGIEVLSHEAGVRRSSLYSLEGVTRVCRTYAVVHFQDESTARVAEAHADVLAGQSIGTTFKTSGWQIRKATLYIGTISLDASKHGIGELMQLDGEVDLGIHAYQLILEKESQSIDYATIVHAHHPDYLSIDELTELYGEGNQWNPGDAEVASIAAMVLESE